MDLDWDWVEGLQEHRIGELRIDDVIAGHENLRIIFFKANIVLPGDPLPRIWPMTVFAKERQGFTANEIQAWRAMKRLLVSRKYQNFPTA